MKPQTASNLELHFYSDYYVTEVFPISVQEFDLLFIKN